MVINIFEIREYGKVLEFQGFLNFLNLTKLQMVDTLFQLVGHDLI